MKRTQDLPRPHRFQLQRPRVSDAEVAQQIENAIRGRTEKVSEALMVGAPDSDGDDIAAE